MNLKKRIKDIEKVMSVEKDKIHIISVWVDKDGTEEKHMEFYI